MKRRQKRRAIIGAVVFLFFLSAAGIIYLNNSFLPTRIKSLLVKNIQEATHKNVSLGGLSFSIFKGIVLRNLVISDEGKEIIVAKEISCAFFIPPIFQKKVVIPFLKFKSTVIFLERKQDGTLNLLDLLPKDKEASSSGSAFKVAVLNLRVSDSKIIFQDNALPSPFKKNIENLDLRLRLSLPSSVKFSLQGSVPGPDKTNFKLAGEFIIPQQSIVAKIIIQGFSPGEFAAYYPQLGISFKGGLVDSHINLKLKGGFLSVDMENQAKAIEFGKDKLGAVLNAAIKSSVKYNLDNKGLEFSGSAAVADTRVSGLDIIGSIDGIKGQVDFNNSGASCDKLSANIWGQPFEAKLALNNFNSPLLEIVALSGVDLAQAKNILKERLGFDFPGELKGQGSLSLNIKTAIPYTPDAFVEGYLDIAGAALKLEKLPASVENIRGRIKVDRNQANWDNLAFSYAGSPCKTSGTITNFKSPGVQLEFSSSALYLESIFALNDKRAHFSKLKGTYLNSDFFVSGDIDMGSADSLTGDLSAELNVNLEDLKVPLKDYQEALGKIRPAGIVNARLRLYGNLNDFKSCVIEGRFSGPGISVSGLKFGEFRVDYSQKERMIDMRNLGLDIYGGILQGSARINLDSSDIPYTLNLDLTGLKLEELKADIPAKYKDIAGTVMANLNVKGAYADISQLSGSGNIKISEGRLWHLDLFKGLGAVLFTKDFSDIVFSEGSCDFIIRDKYVSTDNLILKSSIANLSGPVKIGFDNSIDASLNVQILDEFAPFSGTLKDITTAIAGQSGRFGIIKISGTLQDPRYRFKTAVVDLLKGITNTIFGGE